MSDGFNSRKAYSVFKKHTKSLRFPYEVALSKPEANDYLFRSSFDPYARYLTYIRADKWGGYSISSSMELQTAHFSEIANFSLYLSLLRQAQRSPEAQEWSLQLKAVADEADFDRLVKLLMSDFQSRIDSFPVIRSMQEYLDFMLPYFDIPTEKCFEAFSSKESLTAVLPGGNNLEVHFGNRYFYGPVAMCAWLANQLQHDVARQRQRLLDVLHLPLPAIPDGSTNEEAFRINAVFGYERQRFIDSASKLFDFEPFKADCIEGLPILSTSTAKEVFTGFDRFMGLGARVV